MDRSDTSNDAVIAEIDRLLKEFEEKFRQGTSDPDHFMTFSELEALYGKLRSDTDALYRSMFQDIMQNIDEKELIRKKKEDMPKEGST